jgi:gliding motility-associated-like protein
MFASFFTTRATGGLLPPITLSITQVNTTCQASNGRIQVTASGGTAPYAYSINGNPPQSFGTFANLPPGTYDITVTDALSVVAMTTVTLTNTFQPPVALTASAVRPSDCTTPDGTLTFGVVGGAPPYQYTVDRVHFQSSNFFSGLNAGAYFAYAVDANGCTTPDNAISTTVVPENCSIWQNGQNLSAVCFPFQSNLGLMNVDGGTPPYSYSLDGINYQSSYLFFPLPEGLYTVHIKDATGKIALFSVGVVDHCSQAFDVSTTEVDAHCGNNGQITVNASYGTPPYTYSINGSSFGATNVFSNLAAGNYTIRVMDADLQVASKFLIIKSNCLSIATSTTKAICGGYNGAITANASNGTAPYSYSIDNINYHSQNEFKGLAGGTYTVYVKDATNSMASASVTVTDVAGPVAGSTAITSATCANNDGTILLSASGGTAPLQYSIDGTTFQGSPSFKNVASGLYNTAIRDANGCVVGQPATVPLVNNLTIDAGSDETICEGKFTTLKLNTNAAHVSWSPAASLNDAAAFTPLASPMLSTKYYVTASTGNCSVKDSVVINVSPAPIAYAGEDVVTCYGGNAMLSGNGGMVASWTPSTFLNSTSVFDVVVTQPDHSLTYTLNVTDNKGCTSLVGDEVNVVVTPPSIVFAGNDTSIAAGQSITLNAVDVNGAGFTKYVWTPSSTLNDGFTQRPISAPQQNTMYIVKASTPIGCEGVDTINVKVFLHTDIYVANAFTPNGDGRNDVLYAVPIGIKEFKYLMVFDRWGNIVFRTADSAKGWDGRLSANRKDSGTYVWVTSGIDFAGNVVVRKGTVTLIR